MFKFVIQGSTAERPRPVTLALTHYSDLAEYIRDHAPDALDPTGEMGLTVSVLTRPEADCFIHRSQGKGDG